MPEASVIPVEKLAAVGARHPELSLLLLFGSRARGDAREDSDWDLGYLAEVGMDPDALLLDLVDAVGTDRVDLADLSRAGAQIAFRAASEGRLLYEAAPGLFDRFWFGAVDFWCDVEPILRIGYADVLARLRR